MPRRRALLLLLAVSFVVGYASTSRRSAGGARAEAAGVGAAAAEARRATTAADPLSAYLELAARTGLDEEGLAELRRAQVLVREGSGGASLEAFGRAAERLPGLADWIQILAVDGLAHAGDTAAVRRLLAASEATLARDRGWRLVVQARAIAGDGAGARAAAEAAGLRLEDARARGEAWRLLGELRLAGGDTTGARIALRLAIDNAPGSPAAVAAATALAGLPHAAGQDWLRIGRVYLRTGTLDRGIKALDAYLASESDADAAQPAAVQLEIGRALLGARRYADAERRLLRLQNRGAPDSVAAEALLLGGRARQRMGRVADAQTAYTRVAERFPRERAAAEAHFLLADIEHDAGRLTSARAFYRAAMESGGNSRHPGEAAMRLGGLAYLDGDYAAALEVFETYRTAHAGGAGNQQASYWAARMLRQLEQEEQAQERLREAWLQEPTSYYGLRAAELLGHPEWSAFLAASPVTAERTETEVTGAFVRLEALDALALTDAAAYERERVKRYLTSKEGGLYALAEAFQARGRIADGIRLGREIRRQEGRWNERLLRIVYPFPYRTEILEASSRRGLDPFLVAGLIRQESLFEPGAVSRAGAVGLMQIMPATARALARREGMGRFQLGLLKQPETNVRLGSLFLADLLARYDGRLADALVAYNAGPTRLVSWRALAEYGDEDLFAERIPFVETREYLKLVQQNWRIYTALYAGRLAPASTDAE
ncbi:MAG: transglycosylase SLT domain-containing protein [Gemmatimonadetes bacterium]|nr:transglycosylase SLT domain-containing protein [Gemmatimonadota bacterium]